MSEFIQNGEKDKFDSREKLEADIIQHSKVIHTFLGDLREGFNMVNASVDVIRGWLDRQAAITERECDTASWKANYRHVMKQRDKLQERVDELEEREAELVVVDWWTDEHGDTHAIAANGEEVCHYVKGEHAEAVNREIEELRDKIDRLGIALTAALKTGARLQSENNKLRELLGSDAE